MSAQYIVKGETGDWELVIGLEVHAQISSNAKLFSGASTTFGAAPNAQVSFVDAGFPGMLPVINQYCVEQAVKTGLGINAQINLRSVFDRKNYFYPDLPQGYQISQFLQPIVGSGRIRIELAANDIGESREIGITRLHLEQDAGKSIHDMNPTQSFVDLNRSGVALMEIVSEPELRTPDEAVAYLKKLRGIMRYIGSCDGNMEEGSLRCDANVSVRRVGVAEFGTRCEIKNINSFRHVSQAIAYEARRQVEVLEGGGSIDQETRLWDTGKGETRAMRSKEDAHDYRYFPDPDLLPLQLDAAWVGQLRSEMPELPDEKQARYMEQFGLSSYDAAVLSSERAIAAYYEQAASGRDAKQAANWVMGELFAALNKQDKDIDQSPVSARQLNELLGLMADGTLSGKLAKDVFAVMLETGEDASAIVQSRGLRQVTDESAIGTSIDEMLAANADKLAEYRSGKDKLFGFFVGQAMKATGGRANPEALNRILKEKLQG